MPRPHAPALVVACLFALATAPAARADDAVAEVGDTPVAAHAGWTAWSEPAGDRYELMLRDPRGSVERAPLSSSSRPFDVALGPDAGGDTVAVYQRCGSSGCDLRRLDLETGRDERLESVSSSSHREATPAIWRSTVAFTRRIDGCDVPYVKTLGSSEPSRRLLHAKCVQTPAGHVAVRGSTVVVSSRDGETSEVRRYAGGSSERLLDTREPGRFGQVALAGDEVTTVRHGTAADHAFVRVSGGRVTEVPAALSLSGAYASGVYVEAQDAETDTCSVPCRVVLQSSSPFGHAERPLPPQATVGFVSTRGGNPRVGEPLPFVGTVTRPVVVDGRVVRREPLAGVPVELHHRTETGFASTPYRATTGPDGAYRVVVPAPVPREPWFTAVAHTTPVASWAGAGTVGLATP